MGGLCLWEIYQFSCKQRDRSPGPAVEYSALFHGMHLIGPPVHVLPGKGPVLQHEVAAHAVLLGDGGGAGVDIEEIPVGPAGGDVEVAVDEDGPLGHRRRVVLAPQVAVGGVEPQAVDLQQGVVGHHGELEHHLVNLRVAVAPDRHDLVPQGVELLRHRHAVVVLGQGVAGAVVEQVPHEQQLVGLLGLEGGGQFFRVVGGPVDVRGDH